ncbi:hypothetical protein ACFL1F_00770, partial [Chlamydiota bacterium]
MFDIGWAFDFNDPFRRKRETPEETQPFTSPEQMKAYEHLQQDLQQKNAFRALGEKQSPEIIRANQGVNLGSNQDDLNRRQDEINMDVNRVNQINQQNRQFDLQRAMSEAEKVLRQVSAGGEKYIKFKKEITPNSAERWEMMNKGLSLYGERFSEMARGEDGDLWQTRVYFAGGMVAYIDDKTDKFAQHIIELQRGLTPDSYIINVMDPNDKGYGKPTDYMTIDINDRYMTSQEFSEGVYFQENNGGEIEGLLDSYNIDSTRYIDGNELTDTAEYYDSLYYTESDEEAGIEGAVEGQIKYQKVKSVNANAPALVIDTEVEERKYEKRALTPDYYENGVAYYVIGGEAKTWEEIQKEVKAMSSEDRENYLNDVLLIYEEKEDVSHYPESDYTVNTKSYGYHYNDQELVSEYRRDSYRPEGLIQDFIYDIEYHPKGSDNPGQMRSFRQRSINQFGEESSLFRHDILYDRWDRMIGYTEEFVNEKGESGVTVYAVLAFDERGNVTQYLSETTKSGETDIIHQVDAVYDDWGRVVDYTWEMMQSGLKSWLHRYDILYDALLVTGYTEDRVSGGLDTTFVHVKVWDIQYDNRGRVLSEHFDEYVNGLRSYGVRSFEYDGSLKIYEKEEGTNWMGSYIRERTNITYDGEDVTHYDEYIINAIGTAQEFRIDTVYDAIFSDGRMVESTKKDIYTRTGAPDYKLEIEVTQSDFTYDSYGRPTSYTMSKVRRAFDGGDIVYHEMINTIFEEIKYDDGYKVYDKRIVTSTSRPNLETTIIRSDPDFGYLGVLEGYKEWQHQKDITGDTPLNHIITKLIELEWNELGQIVLRTEEIYDSANQLVYKSITENYTKFSEFGMNLESTKTIKTIGTDDVGQVVLDINEVITMIDKQYDVLSEQLIHYIETVEKNYLDYVETIETDNTVNLYGQIVSSQEVVTKVGSYDDINGMHTMDIIITRSRTNEYNDKDIMFKYELTEVRSDYDDQTSVMSYEITEFDGLGNAVETVEESLVSGTSFYVDRDYDRLEEVTITTSNITYDFAGRRVTWDKHEKSIANDKTIIRAETEFGALGLEIGSLEYESFQYDPVDYPDVTVTAELQQGNVLYNMYGQEIEKTITSRTWGSFTDGLGVTYTTDITKVMNNKKDYNGFGDVGETEEKISNPAYPDQYQVIIRDYFYSNVDNILIEINEESGTWRRLEGTSEPYELSWTVNIDKTMTTLGNGQKVHFNEIETRSYLPGDSIERNRRVLEFDSAGNEIEYYLTEHYLDYEGEVLRIDSTESTHRISTTWQNGNQVEYVQERVIGEAPDVTITQIKSGSQVDPLNIERAYTISTEYGGTYVDELGETITLDKVETLTRSSIQMFEDINEIKSYHQEKEINFITEMWDGTPGTDIQDDYVANDLNGYGEVNSYSSTGTNENGRIFSKTTTAITYEYGMQSGYETTSTTGTLSSGKTIRIGTLYDLKQRPIWWNEQVINPGSPTYEITTTDVIFNKMGEMYSYRTFKDTGEETRRLWTTYNGHLQTEGLFELTNNPEQAPDLTKAIETHFIYKDSGDLGQSYSITRNYNNNGTAFETGDDFLMTTQQVWKGGWESGITSPYANDIAALNASLNLFTLADFQTYEIEYDENGLEVESYQLSHQYDTSSYDKNVWEATVINNSYYADDVSDSGIGHYTGSLSGSQSENERLGIQQDGTVILDVVSSSTESGLSYYLDGENQGQRYGFTTVSQSDVTSSLLSSVVRQSTFYDDKRVSSYNDIVTDIDIDTGGSVYYKTFDRAVTSIAYNDMGLESFSQELITSDYMYEHREVSKTFDLWNNAVNLVTTAYYSSGPGEEEIKDVITKVVTDFNEAGQEIEYTRDRSIDDAGELTEVGGSNVTITYLITGQVYIETSENYTLDELSDRTITEYTYDDLGRIIETDTETYYKIGESWEFNNRRITENDLFFIDGAVMKNTSSEYRLNGMVEELVSRQQKRVLQRDTWTGFELEYIVLNESYDEAGVAITTVDIIKNNSLNKYGGAYNTTTSRYVANNGAADWADVENLLDDTGTVDSADFYLLETGNDILYVDTSENYISYNDDAVDEALGWAYETTTTVSRKDQNGDVKVAEVNLNTTISRENGIINHNIVSNFVVSITDGTKTLKNETEIQKELDFTSGANYGLSITETSTTSVQDIYDYNDNGNILELLESQVFVKTDITHAFTGFDVGYTTYTYVNGEFKEKQKITVDEFGAFGVLSQTALSYTTTDDSGFSQKSETYTEYGSTGDGAIMRAMGNSFSTTSSVYVDATGTITARVDTSTHDQKSDFNIYNMIVHETNQTDVLVDTDFDGDYFDVGGYTYGARSYTERYVMEYDQLGNTTESVIEAYGITENGTVTETKTSITHQLMKQDIFGNTTSQLSARYTADGFSAGPSWDNDEQVYAASFDALNLVDVSYVENEEITSKGYVTEQITIKADSYSGFAITGTLDKNVVKTDESAFDEYGNKLESETYTTYWDDETGSFENSTIMHVTTTYDTNIEAFLGNASERQSVNWYWGSEPGQMEEHWVESGLTNEDDFVYDSQGRVWWKEVSLYDEAENISIVDGTVSIVSGQSVTGTEFSDFQYVLYGDDHLDPGTGWHPKDLDGFSGGYDYWSNEMKKYVWSYDADPGEGETPAPENFTQAKKYENSFEDESGVTDVKAQMRGNYLLMDTYTYVDEACTELVQSTQTNRQKEGDITDLGHIAHESVTVSVCSMTVEGDYVVGDMETRSISEKHVMETDTKGNALESLLVTFGVSETGVSTTITTAITHQVASYYGSGSVYEQVSARYTGDGLLDKSIGGDGFYDVTLTEAELVDVNYTKNENVTPNGHVGTNTTIKYDGWGATLWDVTGTLDKTVAIAGDFDSHGNKLESETYTTYWDEETGSFENSTIMHVTSTYESNIDGILGNASDRQTVNWYWGSEPGQMEEHWVESGLTNEEDFVYDSQGRVWWKEVSLYDEAENISIVDGTVSIVSGQSVTGTEFSDFQYVLYGDDHLDPGTGWHPKDLDGFSGGYDYWSNEMKKYVWSYDADPGEGETPAPENFTQAKKYENSFEDESGVTDVKAQMRGNYLLMDTYTYVDEACTELVQSTQTNRQKEGDITDLGHIAHESVTVSVCSMTVEGDYVVGDMETRSISEKHPFYFLPLI